jgi:hypothetical protein
MNFWHRFFQGFYVGLATFALVFSTGGVVLLKLESDELRKDVNRTSKMLSHCAFAIEEGIYPPELLSVCMDDFAQGLNVTRRP